MRVSTFDVDISMRRGGGTLHFDLSRADSEVKGCVSVGPGAVQDVEVLTSVYGSGLVMSDGDRLSAALPVIAQTADVADYVERWVSDGAGVPELWRLASDEWGL